jgi:SAM-dependent methyltransferase
MTALLAARALQMFWCLPTRVFAPMTIQLIRPPGPNEQRTPAQLWEQYEIEKEIAAKLRNASQEDRKTLYSKCYEELFQRVPHHSQLTYKASEADRIRRVALQSGILKPYLHPTTTFLEIGAGDCALSFAISGQVKKVYALDVSNEITRAQSVPTNFELVLSDGTNIPVPRGSIDVAYSNQLMEHLHPDDALQQLTNIHEALAPGGIYICLTPSRLTGPHDISGYFENVATGLHLKEYTLNELVDIFSKVGFTSIQQCFRKRDKYVRVPSTLARGLERSFERLPKKLRTRTVRSGLVRGLLEIRMIAKK